MQANRDLIDFMKRPISKAIAALCMTATGRVTPIGIGHFVHAGKRDSRNSSEEKFKTVLTDSQVEQLFWDDMRQPTADINNQVRVPLTQNQFDSLASLVFNIGPSGFNHSSLLRLLNTGDYLGAARHFEDFHYAHHNPVPGLTDRRRKEQELFSRR